MFTVGFTIGAVFSFVTFAAKKPEEEEYLPESKPLTTTYLSKDSLSVDKAPTASFFETDQRQSALNPWPSASFLSKTKE